MAEEDLWHLSHEELMQATENFSSSNLLGRGGFGEVYKGQLHGTLVAIKRLHAGGQPGEFEAEVEVLRQLRHPHIVLLMGCAPASLCMVSEYMAGGSLYDRLAASASASASPLSWEERLRIGSEIAGALLYMHSRRVLHRDLKPANVLLDRHNASKLTDMGLAKLFPDQSAVHSGPRVRGTIGYIDPYYLQTLQLTKQYDVYALGLILLQLVTGLHRVSDLHKLLETCGPSLPRRNLQTAMDVVMQHLDSSAGRWPLGLTREVLRLGLLCAEQQKDLRPSLERIVQPELQRIAQEGDRLLLLRRRLEVEERPPIDLQIRVQHLRGRAESDTEGSCPALTACENESRAGMKRSAKAKAAQKVKGSPEGLRGQAANPKQTPRGREKKGAAIAAGAASPARGSPERGGDFFSRALMRQWSWRGSFSRSQIASPDDRRSHGREKANGSQAKKGAGHHGAAPPPASPRSPQEKGPKPFRELRTSEKKWGETNLQGFASAIQEDTMAEQQKGEAWQAIVRRTGDWQPDGVQGGGFLREFEAGSGGLEEGKDANYKFVLSIPRTRRQTDGNLSIDKPSSEAYGAGEAKIKLVARLLEEEKIWALQKAKLEKTIAKEAGIATDEKQCDADEKEAGPLSGPFAEAPSPTLRVLRRAKTEMARRTARGLVPEWPPAGKLSTEQRSSLELYEVSLATGLGAEGAVGEGYGVSLAYTPPQSNEVGDLQEVSPVCRAAREGQRQSGEEGSDHSPNQVPLVDQWEGHVLKAGGCGPVEEHLLAGNGTGDSSVENIELFEEGRDRRYDWLKSNSPVSVGLARGEGRGQAVPICRDREYAAWESGSSCYTSPSPSHPFLESHSHVLSALDLKRHHGKWEAAFAATTPLLERLEFKIGEGGHRRASSETIQSRTGWRSEDDLLSSTTSASPTDSSPVLGLSPGPYGSPQQQPLLVELERQRKRADQAEKGRQLAEDRAERVLAEANRSFLEAELQYKKKELASVNLFGMVPKHAAKDLTAAESTDESAQFWADSMDHEGGYWAFDGGECRWVDKEQGQMDEMGVENRKSVLRSSSEFREYTEAEIQVATGNFSSTRKIGQGSNNIVYSGMIQLKGDVSASVAIKVLKHKIKSEKNSNFELEVCKLSRIKHPHIVQLTGYCLSPCALIYERLPGGSLEEGLRGQSGKICLSWCARLRIAAEVASALLELHCQPEPVVHSNLQAAKVLLDTDLNAKLEVGPSKAAVGLSTETRTLKAWGMFRHVDPEYQHTGVFTTMSDVFSFGILLLDILTGMRPEAYWGVEDAAEKGDPEQLMEVLDPFAGDWPMQLAMEVADLAVACSEMRSRKRPDLRTAVIPMMNTICAYGRAAEAAHKRRLP